MCKSKISIGCDEAPPAQKQSASVHVFVREVKNFKIIWDNDSFRYSVCILVEEYVIYYELYVVRFMFYVVY